MSLNRSIREEFPLLVSNDVAYLDNAATAQRPACVLDEIRRFYENANANPLRGLYALSVEATSEYESARVAVQQLLNAAHPEEIVFTRNTTEAINLVAYSYGLNKVKQGDNITISIMEHHSNMLPWQMVAGKTGATLTYLECEKDGALTEDAIRNNIPDNTKIVAITHVSNVLGRTTPVETVVARAKEVGAVVLLDAAQSVAHMRVDVQKLGVDFLAFSGHKMMGPMGIGALYGKRELLEEMPPFLTGGEMIEYVTRTGATYAELPHKFEAGTVNAAGAVGLHAAIDFVNRIGYENMEERELLLTRLALDGIKDIPHVHVLGSEDPHEHCGIINFTIDGVHPHDVSQILDSDNVAVRAGHHCAQPLLAYLGVRSTTRASIMFYNTEEEIQRFLKSVSTVRERMGYSE
ncbi:MAG: cysteine desulfurase [Oscillospiraceae bacterium]|nr:cysteine desulfurase [Oscillospiraceae bacterium]